jgi:hypothetical protein
MTHYESKAKVKHVDSTVESLVGDGFISKLRQNFFSLARAEIRGKKGEKEEKVESKKVLGLITKSLKS